jgi:mannose-1-phosphate guanylyltransferase / phosphomannomutase
MNTAVVLAGGHGMRLWPLTQRLPKPMLAIDSRPILEFVVSGLRASGIRRLLVVLQFHPGSIVRHFGNGEKFGVGLDYLLQEGDLGTAGSVKQAARFLDQDDFLVSSSDILFHGDLAEGEEFHRASGGEATIALTEVDEASSGAPDGARRSGTGPSGFGPSEFGPSEFGTVRVDPRGRITEFREKPLRGTVPSKLVNAGIYFLSRRALAVIPEGVPFDFGHQLFPSLVQRGRPIHGWRLPGYWRDIGTPEALSAARRDVRELPVFKNLITSWPAPRAGDGGRIWICRQAATGDWQEMEIGALCQAAGEIWQQLSRRGERLVTLAEVPRLSGVKPRDAQAALCWLAREGKVRFHPDGQDTKVEFASPELEPSAR